jgi:ribose-phosphate pyrophosphokinase
LHRTSALINFLEMIGFHFSQREIKIIGGTSHPQVAKAIALKLNVPLARVFISRLPNREVSVIMGESVREADVYIVQTNYSEKGALNENLFELLQLISACKAGSAGKITAGNRSQVGHFLLV